MKKYLMILEGIGLLMILFAPVSFALHAASTTAVLTQAESADEQKVQVAFRVSDATNYWYLWLVAGGAVFLVSALGIRSQKP